MNGRRASGVLLHPTSLPAAAPGEAHVVDAGSGDLGRAAFAFIDWLAAAGQSLWQVLPLNPPGPGNSPYTSVSAWAGNPALISPTVLAEDGLLNLDESPGNGDASAHTGSVSRIDFGTSTALRMQLLRNAAVRFFATAAGRRADIAAFDAWCTNEQSWLADYALFMALRESCGTDLCWAQWPTDVAAREPGVLRAARVQLADTVRFWSFVQWQFARQWQAVREHCRQRGVRIIGDMPIYVAWDSVDVWANSELFDLGRDYRPRVVAGVPPDYFSADGQLWGNPLYRWSRHAEQGYVWWQTRVIAALANADLVRIDHFRAFESYWEVAADAETAIDGQWQAGPGQALFTALAVAVGEPLPLIAEDLGTITPAVMALRQSAGLPGMRVLQFAFGGDADDLNLPHNVPEACAVYTGTHDNDTSLGWFATASARERDFARIYLKSDGHEIGWDLIHAASTSVARYAVYPMQDVLGVGSEARMNVPGLAGGQWGWRFDWAQVAPWQARRLREISAVHGRNDLSIDQSMVNS